MLTSATYVITSRVLREQWSGLERLQPNPLLSWHLSDAKDNRVPIYHSTSLSLLPFCVQEHLFALLTV